jgi:SAM-dependent methyltransferase
MDSTAWDERYAAQDSLWGLEPNQFVRAQCESLAAGDAVDLACGEGRNALWLASLGWRVTGIDFSAVAIDRAERLAGRLSPGERARLTWRMADLTAMALPRSSIDLALVVYLHLPAHQLAGLLTTAAAALRPHGRLVVVGHDKRNLAEGVSGPQDISLLYDPGELARLLSDEAGLEVELAETSRRATPDGIALDTVVRAQRTRSGADRAAGEEQVGGRHP